MVFTSSTGNYYDRSLLNTQFKRFLKRSNMPHLTLHGLRHTYASILMDSGVGIKTITAQLGVTGDIYVHVLNKQKAKMTTIIDSELL